MKVMEESRSWVILGARWSSVAPPSCSPLLDAGAFLRQPTTSSVGSWMEICLKCHNVPAEKMMIHDFLLVTMKNPGNQH